MLRLIRQSVGPSLSQSVSQIINQSIKTFI